MMEKIIINSEKTCAVTGNRELSYFFDREKLERELENITEKEYDTFLVGMALGFDTECFHALENIRKKKKIKIIACVPCENQEIKFSEIHKKEYYRMIDSADEKIYTGYKYTPYCMQKRNMFMVDNCSLLFAYMRKTSGGTVNTVNYAKRKEKRIIFF